VSVQSTRLAQLFQLNLEFFNSKKSKWIVFACSEGVRGPSRACRSVASVWIRPVRPETNVWLAWNKRMVDLKQMYGWLETNVWLTWNKRMVDLKQTYGWLETNVWLTWNKRMTGLKQTYGWLETNVWLAWNKRMVGLKQTYGWLLI
jgi:hypothetical protein